MIASIFEALTHPQIWFEIWWCDVLRNYTHQQIWVVGAVLIQFVSYSLCCIPSFIFGWFSFFDKWKIQPDVVMTGSEQFQCFRTVIITKCLIYIPLAISLWPAVEKTGLPFEYDDLPSWHLYPLKLIGCLVIEDSWHYFFHRVAHIKFLYPKVHKVHHKYAAPFSIAAEYAHPIETAVLGAGFFVPLVIFCDHIVFFWVWTFIRVWEACDIHTGYAIHTSPFFLLPFYGGAKFHDFHHSNFTVNYASTFTYLDWIFKTDESYQIDQAKKTLRKFGLNKNKFD